MPAGRSKAPTESNFNDLSRDSENTERASQSPKGGGSSTHSAEGGEGWVPRPKRIACILCRKRKLRCDGNKPSCGTCSRLGHDCSYDEVRKKSGPKRGYVKLLEARLSKADYPLSGNERQLIFVLCIEQVENMLGTQAPTEGARNSTASMTDIPQPSPFTQPNNVPLANTPGEPLSMPDFSDPSVGNLMSDFGMGATDDFSWDMIGLGLEEPLPSQDIIDDMTQIYFEKIHPSLPMIHRPRFLAAMDLAPHMRPPVALRYAMWTQVCSITPRYYSLQEHFYARARKYAELDEMKGHGENMITLAHAQAWSLIAAFEFKMMFFPRAWMSCGRATRLCQMMGLHRLDGVGLEVKQCLPPPRDWTEREERRRTFWMAFCQDRYASIGTGWPMTIDEQDILTNLPANEDAFNKSKPERTLSLADVMTADGASTLSPFAGVVLMACLFGRNLTHLHRPNEQDRDHDMNGEFWKRHRALDNILLNTSLSLPAQLRLPAGISDANIVFCNMNIHTSTICLHQAAIFKADKNRMPPQISAESKRRCIIAADQITNIMKMISHIDLSTMNPFIAFCLYVAARVFVQYLKSRKDDATVKSSLHFLLSAMQALKSKNPLTESFLVQLDVDLEGSGLSIPSNISRYQPGEKRGPHEIPVNFDSVKCVPLFEIRESQAVGQNGQATPDHPPIHNVNHIARNFTQLASGQNPSSSNLPSRTRTSSRPDMAEAFGAGVNVIYGDAQGAAMDLSPDVSTGEAHVSKGTPDHPTPSTSSNKGSSHTSFTPPHFDDNSHSGYPSSTTMSPNTAANAYFQNAESYTPFSPEMSAGNKEGSGGLPGTFSFPASWDYSANGPANTGTGMKDHNPTGLTPGPTGMTPGPTGMSPIAMPDGSWNLNALEGNEWMFANWSAPSPQ